MANLSKLDYQGKYNNSSTGLFKDNTTKDIGADDVRTLVEDTSDSFYNKTDDAHTLIPQFTASGTDTYTATPSPAISSYAAGQTFKILFTNANTGAATLNLNGVGAASITKNGTTALQAGDISAGSIKILAYDGTRFQMISGTGTGAGGRVRTVTGADNSEQLDNQGLIIFNSATPFDFTLDELDDDTVITFVNYGAGAVTFIEGSGVTAPTGNVVLSGSIGDSYPSAMVHYVTGTTPRVINAGTNGLALVTADTSGGTITLNFAMEKERLFVGSASFATAKDIALSNDDNALVFSLTVTLTNAAAVLTFPSTFTMPNSDIRWNDSAHTFTITAGTVGKYVFVATWDGTDWNMEATNPFA